MSIRVMLGDDHRIFIEALAGILSDEPDIVVVSCVGSAAEIFAEIGRVRPDVLILDVGLPDENGIEVMQRLRREHAGARVLALSGYADRTFVEEMLKTRQRKLEGLKVAVSGSGNVAQYAAEKVM